VEKYREGGVQKLIITNNQGAIFNNIEALSSVFGMVYFPG